MNASYITVLARTIIALFKWKYELLTPFSSLPNYSRERLSQTYQDFFRKKYFA